MLISPADLRAMLRADAVELVLGVLLVLTGLLTVALVGVLRQRVVLLLWLGAFSLLYGIRLLVRTGVFRLYFDFSPEFWAYADAAMTYAVPIPLVLFARAALPAWRRFWTIGASGLTAFASLRHCLRRDPRPAKLGDHGQQPHRDRVLRRRPWLDLSYEASRHRATCARCALGVLAISLTAVADNLRGIGVLGIPGAGSGTLRFYGPHRMPRHNRDAACARRRAASVRHRSRVEHRAADPVFDPSPNHASDPRNDHRGAIPADDRRRGRLL